MAEWLRAPSLGLVPRRATETDVVFESHLPQFSFHRESRLGIVRGQTYRGPFEHNQMTAKVRTQGRRDQC